MWKNLNTRQKSDVMAMAVQQGLYDLNEIRALYDQSVLNTLTDIEDTFKEEVGPPPSYNYTHSTEWAEAHGYYPDERGHRSDAVKYPTHPTHPSKGEFIGNEYHFSEKGMEDPNHTLWGMRDNGDGLLIPMYNNTRLLPEITVEPNDSYILNSYDNIKYRP